MLISLIRNIELTSCTSFLHIPYSNITRLGDITVGSLVLTTFERVNRVSIFRQPSSWGILGRYLCKARRLIGPIVILLNFCLAPLSRAQESENAPTKGADKEDLGVSAKDQFKALIKEAFKLAPAGQYDEAIRKLNQAYKLYPKSQILFNIAELEDRKGNNCRTAHAAFIKFLAQCPDCKQRTLGQSRLNQLEQKCFVQVAIKTEPPGATVFIDSKNVGQSPVKLEKHWAGPATLRIELDGYNTFLEKVSFAKRTPYHRTIRLEQLEGRVRIINRPKNTEVYIDDRRISGKTPQDLTLTVGQHEAKIGQPSVTEIILVDAVKISILDIHSVLERNSPHLLSSRPKVWPFWVSAGTAVAAAGVGTGFLIAQGATRGRANDALGMRQAELIDQASTEGDVGLVALSVASGATLVAIGTWLWPALRGQGKPLF